MPSTLTASGASPARVVRDGDRVLIDGVTHPGWAGGSSVHSARAVILQTLGIPLTYDELVGYDALAFRVQLMAFCPSSPHSSCGYRCNARSLQAMPLDSSFHHLADLKPDNPEHARRLDEARQQVMASIDRGIPVEYGGIEDGVVVGYQADGQEWLCLHPLSDNAKKLQVRKDLEWGALIFTGPKPTPPTPAELAALARQSMEQAVAMWSTPRAGDKNGYHLGEAAWTLWIDELSKPMDDEQATKHQQGNAWTYDATTGYRRSAVVYLRKIAPMFDPPAADHLGRAAKLYEQMATEVLADKDHCITSIAPYPWNGKWTAEQRADQVRRMKQAMELDRQAIGELEQALGKWSSPAAAGATEPLISRVRHDGGRVTIEGIQHPGFGRYASSVHGARAVIMATLGESMSYEELVGYDALAFRVQFMSGFCPSSPHSCCGFLCRDRSVAAMPWEATHRLVADLKADNPSHAGRLREVRRLVMASIDRGIPVEYGATEDGVIIGYQVGGDEWIGLHPMHDGAQKPHIEKDLTWGILIFTGPKQAPPDLATLARQSLEQAVTMWGTPRAGRGDGYYVGEAAWKQWIEELSKPMVDEQAAKHQQGNAWIYESTINHRQSAAVYLRKIAPLLGSSAAEHLDRAAVLYGKMANDVLADAEHPRTTITPHPWTGPWTADHRAEQVRRMMDAVRLDREAIRHLELAIQSSA